MWGLLVKDGAGSTPGRSRSQLLNEGGWLVGRYIQLLDAGWGWLAGPVQEEKSRPGRPVQNIFDVGGGGGLEGTHWSLYTFIAHTRLPPSQQFSASQDADSILLALNNSSPWAHLHSLSNETGIPLNGISVQSNH